jgi:hypothetical protein
LRKLVLRPADDRYHREHRYEIALFVWAKMKVPSSGGFDGEDRFVCLYFQEAISHLDLLSVRD